MNTWPPDWSKLPPWARYVVIQPGGSGMATEAKPHLRMVGTLWEAWFSGRGQVKFFDVGNVAVDWRESLRERGVQV
jgi:hypothetical protein